MQTKVEQDRMVKATYTRARRQGAGRGACRAASSSGYQVRPIAPEGTDPSQAWFWTPEWQAKEREADADLAAGRTTFHASDDEFFAAVQARRPDVADA